MIEEGLRSVLYRGERGTEDEADLWRLRSRMLS
jgi:hypothetical protein